MDQTTTGTEGDDHCVTETEEDTLAQRRKRAKRVSFVERDVTSIRIFEPDEDSATPPNKLPNVSDDADKPVLGYFQDSDEANQNDADSGDEREDENPGKVFFRPLESLSPGSSIIGSATSNDEHFFGPVSTNFIKHGRLSDSTYDDHEMTMDSTAFSMHYRSLMDSNSLDLKTPLSASPMSSSAKIPNGKSNLLDFSTPTERVSLETDKIKKLFFSEKDLLPVSGEAIGDEISRELSKDLVPNSTFSNSLQNITAAAVDEVIDANELTNDAIIQKVCNEISQSGHILNSPEHCEPKIGLVVVNDELADDTVADNNLCESFSSKATKQNYNDLEVPLSTPNAKYSECVDRLGVPDEHLVTHNSLENQLNDNIKSVSVERQSWPSLGRPVFSSTLRENHSSYATPSTQNLYANELHKSIEKRGSLFKRSISWTDVCAPSPLGSLLKDGNERSKQKVSQLRMRGRTPISSGKRMGPAENALFADINLEISPLDESLFNNNQGSDVRIIPNFPGPQTELQRVGHLTKEFRGQNSPAFIDTKSLTGNFTPNNLVLHSKAVELGIQNDATKLPDFFSNAYNTPSASSKYPQHCNSKDILASGGSGLPHEDSVGKVLLAAKDVLNQLQSVDSGGKHNIDKNGNPVNDDFGRDGKIRKTEGCFKPSNSISDAELHSKQWEKMFSKISSCNEALLPSLAKTFPSNSISLLIDRITEQQKIKKYSSLCFHLQSLEKHMPEQENDPKKVSEMRMLLFQLVYEKAKVELLNLQSDICSKVYERIRSSSTASQELKSFLHQSLHKQDRKVSSNEGSPSLDSVCFADEFSSEKMKLEFGAIEKRRKLMDKAQSYGVTLAKEPRCSEIDALLANKLNKKIVSQVLRGSLQLWKLEKFSSGLRKYNISLNYRGFVLQRFTITRAQSDSVHVSIEMNEKHIAKHFPCTNAVVAFGFVLKPVTEQMICPDRMRHVAQNVSFLLGNVVEVMEEIQFSLLKCGGLVRARFVSNEEELVLELGFVGLKSGTKATVALDLSALRCGAYPSEVVPFRIDTNGESLSWDVFGEVPAGLSKIYRISCCVLRHFSYY